MGGVLAASFPLLPLDVAAPRGGLGCRVQLSAIDAIRTAATAATAAIRV
jgi:hypothetical protein